MKKNKFHNITKSKGFKLAIGLTASVGAVGATCGLAIGLCATSTTKYIEINPYSEDESNRVWFADEKTKDATA